MLKSAITNDGILTLFLPPDSWTALSLGKLQSQPRLIS